MFHCNIVFIITFFTPSRAALYQLRPTMTYLEILKETDLFQWQMFLLEVSSMLKQVLIHIPVSLGDEWTPPC